MDELLRKRDNLKLVHESFECYIDLIDLIKKMDGKLFSFAMKVLKQQLRKNFKHLMGKGQMKRLCPEYCPDVFKRLYYEKGADLV